GPDYIDPAFHAAASGRPCLTLDPWAMRGATLDRLAAELAGDADLVLVEGVMGLFDGARDGSGSTADLAARLSLPVILVVDVRGLGASIAALVDGFRRFRSDVAVSGVICNRISGAAHAEMLRAALAPLDLPLIGCLPAREALSLPSRHLGLVQAREHPGIDRIVADAAATAASHLDLERLLTLAAPLAPMPRETDIALAPLGQRIAVAEDDAFAFAYPHVLEGWRRAGAELLRFSPLNDAAPDASCDAVYVPGGYPELFAGKLAANAAFLEGLRAAAGRGAAIYGECGGYMVLGDALVDAEGARHAMAGLLPLETSFAARKLHLGYRQIALVADAPFGRRGQRFRGHEFHYSSIAREGDGEPLFHASDATGRDLGAAGLRRGRVMGSFLHLIDRA
ncbi:MAG TPA: cobyrinate a,c-diamide synthase, partial [Candidatus Cybelea sp.]|nr:cobyrinate a,c-diamide synthase [Candidatus Cybelea sp.]